MPSPKNTISRALTAVESSGGSWFLLLAGWILSRNWLEGILERPRQMGFDGREDVSFAMYFLHFPVFYLALFLLLCLWLHLLTRRPMPCVLRAVSAGYGLLLLAPLVDFLASRGHGFELRYLLGWGSFLWRFWSPGSALTQVSPGQRLEIVLAAASGGLYVWAAGGAGAPGAEGTRSGAETGFPDDSKARKVEAARDSLVRRSGLALLAAAGIYLLVAFLGAWPSFFARLTVPSAGSMEEAYRRVFQGGGLITGESRRLAIVLALPLLAALPVALYRSAPGRTAALARQLGWIRALHYTGLVPAGAFLGYLTYREFLPVAYTNPVDYAATAILWASMFCAFAASVWWNDLHDLESDRINAPGRPLPSGAVPAAAIPRLAAAAALLSLFLALAVSYQAALLLLCCLFLSHLYSAPPMRWKRWPFLGCAALAGLSLLSAFTGFSLFAQEMTPLVFPRPVALLLLAGITLGFGAKDLKDRRGDAATGVVTLATLVPEPASRRLLAALVALGYMLAPLLLPLGGTLVLLSALFACGSAFVTLRRPRPDGPLLLGFVIFSLLLLGLLYKNPAVLQGRIPAELRSTHAARMESVPELRQMLAADPLRAATWNDLLRAWSESNRDSAAAVCSQALALGVRPGDLLRQRAALRLAETSAAGSGPRAAGEPGTGAASGTRLGQAGQDRSGGASHDLAGAFLFGQREPLLQVLRGDLRMRAGAAEEAREDYARAAEADPSLPEAFAGLGEALHALGQPGPALQALRHAAALNTADPWIRNNAGVVLRDLGQLPEARDEFLAAHELSPGLFEPLYNLGTVSERLGLIADARRWYAEARRLRPGFPPVEDALERLGGESGR